MMIRWMLVLIVAVAGVLGALQLGAGSAARPQPLFTNASYRGDTVRGELAVIRSRAAEMDLDLLRALETNPETILRLNLFPERAFSAVARTFERRGPESFTIIGDLIDDADGRFTLAVENGAVALNVFSRFGSYQARSINGALVAVQELDLVLYPPCACGAEHEVGGAEHHGFGDGGGDDGSIIDVLVVWTPQARTAAGGLANIQAIVENSIAVTNLAYGNSQINPRVRLVYKGEISYVESGNLSTDLGRLRNTSDGHMDDVHQLRDEYGADMVALLCQGSSACGVAYLMTTLSPNFASSAFSVSNYSCAAGNLTFPHELGHNQGSAHDRDNAGSALFPYSYGWRWHGQSSNQYRSVMAYAPGARVAHFTNPDVLYDGVPTGVPVGQQNEAHNALSINQAALTIANWRQSIPPLRFEYPDGRPALVDPDGGTLLRVHVSGQIGGVLDVTSTRLHVDTGGGYAAHAMTHLGDGLFEAAFPSSSCNEIVSYYLSARTIADDFVLDPPSAPGQAFTAYAAENEVILFHDDFETNQGWTVSGNATDGHWERAIPIPWNVCNRGNPPGDADGSGHAYVTDNSPAGGCNSDVDNGSTILTSPLINALGAGDAFISYWRWYDNSRGANPGIDVFTVQVSNNNGGSWTNVEVVGPSGPETTGGWVFKQFRIADFVTPTSQMRFRFIASDLGQQSVVEAGVDGFTLSRFTCASTTLVDVQTTFGQVISGGLDELRESDDAHLRMRSQFGFTALEPNLIETRIGAETTDFDATTLTIRVESRINHSSGTATLRVRDWATGQFAVIDQWSVTNTDQLRETTGVSAAERIRAADGRIEVSVRYVVLATFTALGFDAYLDLVEVSPN